MRYRALVTDYDGTIASDGIVNAATVAALERVRPSGRALLLVTGRELPSLFATFDRVDLFDLVVAENGAVVYVPSSEERILLGSAPPAALVTRLTDEHVPLSVGHSIVATVRPYEHHVLAALRDLGLDWHLIFNKSAVMALPADINKATGLTHALARLAVAADDCVGIGDAENDLAFLRACGLAVAVDNALPTVKQHADWITMASRGAGVEELIGRLLDDTLPRVRQAPTQQHSGASHDAR